MTRAAHTALLLLALLPYGLLAADQTVIEDPVLEAACEGRWPGRFVGTQPGWLYDCETRQLVPADDPFGCKNTTLEICYEDE